MTNTGKRRRFKSLRAMGAKLTAEEERILANRARQGDPAAVTRLLNAHRGYIVKIAARYKGSGTAMADLIQEGTIGLLQALARFNPDQNSRLSTYAMWWIRAAIQAHVMRSWSLVRLGTTAAQKSLFFNLAKLRRRLDESEKTLSESGIRKIARSLGVRERDVRQMELRLAQRDAGLDTGGAGPSEPGTVAEPADVRPTPEQSLIAANEQSTRRALLNVALAKLSPRELTVIRRRYLSDVSITLESLGRELGVSKERVRQIEARAVDKLRRFMVPALEDGKSAG